jgi:hypothetical protein
LLFDALKIENVEASHDSFQFNKRAKLFVGGYDEALSVVAMRVDNPDCFPRCSDKRRSFIFHFL